MDSIFEIFTKLPIDFIDWSQSFLRTLPWQGIIIFIILLLWLENIFPLLPSDSLVLFSGSLVSLGNIGYFPLVLACTIGSTLGFVSMYLIGKQFEEGLIDKGKIKWIKKESIEKAENWFRKYGYLLIVVSRCIAVIRAPITFFAGMSEVKLRISIWIATFSALVWYLIWVYTGFIFADNLDFVKELIRRYGQIIFPIIILGIIVYFIFRKKKSNSN